MNDVKSRLIEILEEINDDIDYETETNLIDGKMLDSFSIIRLISSICEEFEIDIGPKWMKNENFNSVEAMSNMINTILEEE